MTELESHARKHGTVVDHTDPVEVRRWIDLVSECAVLRCPYLRLECEALDDTAASALYKPTQSVGTKLTEAGQYATLTGGMARIVRPTSWPRSEFWWMRHHRLPLAHSPRCTDELLCPDCADGAPCPLDIAHEIAAESLLHENDGTVIEARISQNIMRKGRASSLLGRWSREHPQVAAHVAYLAIVRAEDRGEHGRADTYTRVAREYRLQLVEPRLAVREAQNLIAQGRRDDAEKTLLAARITPSTNPGQIMLSGALARFGSDPADAEPTPRDPRYERLRRPPGRVQARRFARRA